MKKIVRLLSLIMINAEKNKVMTTVNESCDIT